MAKVRPPSREVGGRKHAAYVPPPPEGFHTFGNHRTEEEVRRPARHMAVSALRFFGLWEDEMFARQLSFVVPRSRARDYCKQKPIGFVTQSRYSHVDDAECVITLTRVSGVSSMPR